MITASFYNFSKKVNSTAQPTAGSGTDIQCVLKEASSLLSPRLQLTLQGMPAYNYVSMFGRFYYVDDWTYVKHALWECSLTCDILASFKTEIGAASLYVLRSSAASDGTIVDDLYPAKTSCITHAEYVTSPWVHDQQDPENINLSQGVFVVGYVTKNQLNNTHLYGSVAYSAMEQTGLSSLVDELLDDTLLSGSGFDTNDATLALQKSLIDPLSYIKSVIWLPVLYASIDHVEMQHVSIWDWDITADNKILGNNPPYLQYVVTLPITRHPQAATRGEYLNTSPYTRSTLNVPPFGNIELDSTLTANAQQVQAIILIDLVTGAGICRILIDGIVAAQTSAQIGVPIQISQVSRDYLGASVSGVNGIAGAIGNFTAGNVGGAIQSAASGIGNAVRAMTPRISSMGTAGAFINLKNRPALYQQFQTIADEDLGHLGRPLCQVRQLSTIPGFIQCADGDIDLPGYTEEAAYIKQQLEAGFFYE